MPFKMVLYHSWYFHREYQARICHPIPFWIFALHSFCSQILPCACEMASPWNAMQGNTSQAASFFFPAFTPSFPLPSPTCFPHSFLTCACLCPCVLRPGIKRNTVWTQPMPSKFLAASWLHGMEYLELSFLRKQQDPTVLCNCLEFAPDWIYVYF